MKQNLLFLYMGYAVLTARLLSCETGNSANKKHAQLARATQADPSVVATAQYYARLLTQAAMPLFDSLLHHAQQVAQPDVLPGQYLLRLRAYTVVDSLHPQVTIEPAAHTELYNPLPTAATATVAEKKPVQVVLTPRKTNPTLAISLPELVANFGPWHGDFYVPIEEPLEPDMHTTEINYCNPTTGQLTLIAVRLRVAPSATANAVHDIRLARVQASP